MHCIHPSHSFPTTSSGEHAREKGTIINFWWGCTLVKPLWKIVWRFLKKLKIELPYAPTILILGI
jgi:hypothetical protein